MQENLAGKKCYLQEYLKSLKKNVFSDIIPIPFWKQVIKDTYKIFIKIQEKQICSSWIFLVLKRPIQQLLSQYLIGVGLCFYSDDNIFDNSVFVNYKGCSVNPIILSPHKLFWTPNPKSIDNRLILICQ